MHAPKMNLGELSNILSKKEVHYNDNSSFDPLLQ